MVHSALCTRVLLNLHKAASATAGSMLNSYEKQATLVFDHELVFPQLPTIEDVGTASFALDTVAADSERWDRSDSDTAVGLYV